MITIVDYNAGNLRSVKRACDAVGVEAVLAGDAATLLRATSPGVGAARSAMELLERTKMADALRKLFQSGVPLLGICLGAQLILERSEEGDVECLGLLPGRVRRFQPEDAALKVPHMGWNAVQAVKPHPLLRGLRPGDEFYFVHSYYPDPASEQVVHGVTDYGGPFCCALGRDNLFATQFHPEKSGKIGLEILERFASWDGAPC